MGFPEFNVEVAIIRCEPSGREVRVVHETNLMDAVLQTGLVLGQSCDGIASADSVGSGSSRASRT
jgi:hypothetical protein